MVVLFTNKHQYGARGFTAAIYHVNHCDDWWLAAISRDEDAIYRATLAAKHASIATISHDEQAFHL